MEEKSLREQAAAYIPNWVEFVKVRDKKDADAAAKVFFADPDATANDFLRVFGVNLLTYQNYYLEIALVNAPEGNIYAAKVAPILVIQQSAKGKNFTVHIMKHNGLINPETGRAWIQLDEWEKHVEDNFKEEMIEIIASDLGQRIQASADTVTENGDEQK